MPDHAEYGAERTRGRTGFQEDQSPTQKEICIQIYIQVEQGYECSTRLKTILLTNRRRYDDSASSHPGLCHVNPISSFVFLENSTHGTEAVHH